MVPVSGCVTSFLSIICYTLWLQSIVDAIIPITNPCPTPKQIDCFFVNVTEKEKGVHFQGHQYYVAKKDCENNAKCTSCIEMTHGVVRDAAMKANELYVNALWAVVVEDTAKRIQLNSTISKGVAWWCSPRMPFMWNFVYKCIMGGFFMFCMPSCFVCTVCTCFLVPVCPIADWWKQRRPELFGADDEDGEGDKGSTDQAPSADSKG